MTQQMNQYPSTSTPEKHQSSINSTADEPLTTSSMRVDIAIQTTPKSCCKLPRSSLQRNVSSPLDKKEQIEYTHQTRRNFYENPEFIKCRTGGQPIYLTRVVKPRKSSNVGSSPLKKQRSRQLAKVLKLIAGRDAACAQQASELKLLSKSSKQDVCQKAGVQKTEKLSPQIMLAMKVALGLTTNQSCTQKRYFKSSGIEYSGKKEVKMEMDKLFDESILISKHIDLWHKEEPKSHSIKGMVQSPLHVRTSQISQHSLNSSSMSTSGQTS